MPTKTTQKPPKPTLDTSMMDGAELVTNLEDAIRKNDRNAAKALIGTDRDWEQEHHFLRGHWNFTKEIAIEIFNINP